MMNGHHVRPSAYPSLIVVLFLLFSFGPTVAVAENVDLHWSVDDKQYLLYGEERQENVFDLIGYEVTGNQLPVPDPRLVSEREQLPEYLALILPGRRVQVGSTFRYSFVLTPENDHRFYPFYRWVPSVVQVEGRVKEKTTFEGHDVYPVHQTIKAGMKNSYLQSLQTSSDEDWSYFEDGEMSVDLLFDPDDGLIRKIEYSAECSYGHTGERAPGDVEEDETYTLTANHPVAGSYNDQSFRKRVKQAIEEGVSYLREQQSDGGAWSGRWSDHYLGYPNGLSALATLTLLKCSKDREHPSIEKAMDRLLDQSAEKTYTAALMLMAMQAYKEDPIFQTMEQKYINGKISEEEFQRMRKKNQKNKTKNYTNKEKDWMEDQLQTLLQLMKDGAWTYPDPEYDKTPDNSNVQYGALGLNAAAQLGMRVPSGAWKSMLSHWLDNQAPDGHGVNLKLNVMGSEQTSVSYDVKARGWAYRHQAATEGNNQAKVIAGHKYGVRTPMVVGGIGSVQLALSNLASNNKLPPGLAKKGRNAMLDGAGWLQAHWSLRPHPEFNIGLDGDGWDMVHYYTLYGLERAGMFTRTRTIGGHNWYQEGAELILSRQLENRSWRNNVASTCFALLFLKRATSLVDTVE